MSLLLIYNKHKGMTVKIITAEGTVFHTIYCSQKVKSMYILSPKFVNVIPIMY